METIIFNVLKLLGGLALFLFGMNTMGDGLERRSGSRLKSILENLTNNPLKGVALGALVTAVIQSSSATTVMVVGFVNSGLMKLSQSIGIIMGANIGTTITAWLLSLSGVDGDSFVMQMLKPENFSLIFALIGILLTFSKKEKNKDVAAILLGFTVLMYGMKMMSAAVEPLKEVDEFKNILVMFGNMPLLGVLTGAILTAIIQSSSASVGILQALCTTGAITYSNAIPIIMGQNIGTCITAALAAIGTNKNAKRVAVVHLSFNLIGTILFLAIFYAAHAIIDFGFYNDTMNPANIAVVHTSFNIFTTLALLPFTKQLEKIAHYVIRSKNNTNEIQLLDERLLDTPAVAVQQAKKVTEQMMDITAETLKKSLYLLENYTEATAEEVDLAEEEVDGYEDKLGTYLVRLSRKPMSNDDSDQAANLLHTIGDIERMSDHAANLSKSAKEIHEKQVEFSESGRKELATMSAAVQEIVELTAQCFKNDDTETAAKVEALEQVVDRLKAKLKRNHIARLQADNCTIETGFVFNDLITNLERIADHCSNIAACVIEVPNHNLDTHEYLHAVHRSAEFDTMFQQYNAKYTLQ